MMSADDVSRYQEHMEDISMEIHKQMFTESAQPMGNKKIEDIIQEKRSLWQDGQTGDDQTRKQNKLTIL